MSYITHIIIVCQIKYDKKIKTKIINNMLKKVLLYVTIYLIVCNERGIYMNNDNQRKVAAAVIILVGVLVIALIVIFAINGKKANDGTDNEQKNYEELEDGTLKNNNDNVSKTKKIGDIELEQASLIYKNSDSVLTVNVKNNGTALTNLRINIKYIGNTGEVLGTSLGYVGAIQNGETKQITSGITTDVVNIKDIEYEIMQ